MGMRATWQPLCRRCRLTSHFFYKSVDTYQGSIVPHTSCFFTNSSLWNGGKIQEYVTGRSSQNKCDKQFNGAIFCFRCKYFWCCLSVVIFFCTIQGFGVFFRHCTPSDI